MTNRFLVSVAALALIAGTGLANAQGTGQQSGGGAQMQSAPSSAGGGAAGGATTEHREGGQGMSRSSGMNAEQKSPAVGQNQRAEERERGQRNMNAEGREGRNDERNAENRHGRETERNAQGQTRTNEMNAQGQKRGNEMNAQGRNRSNEMNAQGKTGGRSETTVGVAGSGGKLSTEQRTKIVSVIRGEHVQPVNNVDFAISVGTRVPRERVHLRILPTEVVDVYPEWRGYEFFLIRDKIVVVDPNSLEIVDVLPA